MIARSTIRQTMQRLEAGAFAYVESETRDDATRVARSVTSLTTQCHEFTEKRFTTSQGVAVFYKGDPVFFTRIEREE